MCRLKRWREANCVAPETISALCGFGEKALAACESGIGTMRSEDKFALQLLFGERFSLSVLLERTIASNEETILSEMSIAYARTLAQWQRT